MLDPPRFHGTTFSSRKRAQHRASILRLSIGTPFSSNRRDKSSPLDGWIPRKSSSWLAFEKPFFSIIERVSSTISPTWLESVAGCRAIEIYRGGRARNAFDALDCIKVAANPVRAHLMGYELWRFAPLLSLSFVQRARIVVFDETIAFLLLSSGGKKRFVSLLVGGTPGFYPPSKATLKILTGKESGSFTSLLRIFCEIVYNRGLPTPLLSSLAPSLALNRRRRLLLCELFGAALFESNLGGKASRILRFFFFLLLKLSFKVTRRRRVCCSRQR